MLNMSYMNKLYLWSINVIENMPIVLLFSKKVDLTKIQKCNIEYRLPYVTLLLLILHMHVFSHADTAYARTVNLKCMQNLL